MVGGWWFGTVGMFMGLRWLNKFVREERKDGSGFLCL